LEVSLIGAHPLGMKTPGIFRTSLASCHWSLPTDQ
jgi:hypothetical protein